eukprot:PhM_4_TR1853/c0_g1_i1/m.61564
MYYAYGSCVNHVAKRVYFADGVGGSVYGYPIPNEGYGNLERMAGKNQCTGESDCFGNSVGTFKATKLSMPYQVYSDPNLHPVYFIPDVITRYVYAFDVGTHMSTRYLGNGVVVITDTSSFNNHFRTSASVPPTYDLTSDIGHLYLASKMDRMAYISRVSLSTGMVSVALRLLWNGAPDTELTIRSILHLKGSLFFTVQLVSCVAVVPATGSQTDFDFYKDCKFATNPLIQLPDIAASWFLAVSDNKAHIIISVSASDDVPDAGLYRFDLRQSVLSRVVPHSRFLAESASGPAQIDVHGEYAYVSFNYPMRGKATPGMVRARLDMSGGTQTPTLHAEPTATRSSSMTSTFTKATPTFTKGTPTFTRATPTYTKAA